MKINDRERELFPGEAYFFPKFQNRADRQIFLGTHISSPNLKTGKANSHFWGSTCLPIISNQGRQTRVSGEAYFFPKFKNREGKFTFLGKHISSPNFRTGQTSKHFWGSIISSPNFKTGQTNSHFWGSINLPQISKHGR